MLTAVENHISLFIPHRILNDSPDCSILLGYCNFSRLNVLLNCTSAVDSKTDVLSLNELCDCVNKDPLYKFCVIGLMFTSGKNKNVNFNFAQYLHHNFYFVLHVDNIGDSFHLETLCNLNTDLDNQIILYDGGELVKSDLLLQNDEERFLFFLLKTYESHQKHSAGMINMLSIQSSGYNLLNCYKCVYLILSFFKFCAAIYTSRGAQGFCKFAFLTHIGRQLHQRLVHCAGLFQDLNTGKKLTLKCKNVLSSIFVDILLGWIVTYLLWRSNLPILLLNFSMEQTNYVVTGLQHLIYWLMGVPAGLKLNIPLNSALGQFFLYHIYLWKAYITIVLPIFGLILKISTVVGIFGLSFVLCVLSDLVSLGTVHIYCFYGYAARLYGYQISSLTALWRLFRGKKWNPLRQRVDSYTYDKHQLFLGTLIFTILLFLLPTVIMYYFVFTGLRILVLIFQGIASKLINAFTICPIYSFVMRLCESSETAGDVYFSVFNCNATRVLAMQIIHIPVLDVVKKTIPELYTYEEHLSWSNLLSSIIKGTIIYPL